MFSFISSRLWTVPGSVSIFMVVGFLAGCGVSDPKSPQFVVAKGKGIKITRGELDKEKTSFLAQTGMNQKSITPEIEKILDKQVVEQLVTKTLLLNIGAKLKIPDLDRQVEERIKQIKGRFPDEKVFNEQIGRMGMTMDKVREDVRQQLLIREVLKANVPPALDPSPSEIGKFYNENEKTFMQPPMVKASHILIKVPKDAALDVKAAKKKAIEKARGRIAGKKEDFAKVAKEVSEDPSSASQGGELQGYFRSGEMVPEFEKVAFSSKVGELSPVFETPYGYHFLKVIDSKPAQKVSLEEAQPQIRRYLQSRQEGMAREVYFKQIQTKAKVQYFLPKPETNASAPGGKAVAP